MNTNPNKELKVLSVEKTEHLKQEGTEYKPYMYVFSVMLENDKKFPQWVEFLYFLKDEDYSDTPVLKKHAHNHWRISTDVGNFSNLPTIEAVVDDALEIVYDELYA